MGGTDPEHATVAPGQVRRIVNNLTGTCWCPICPPPWKRKPLEPVESKGLASGLQYAYYEGKFLSIPDTFLRKSDRIGRSKSLSLDITRRKDGCAIVFSGYLLVPADGCYTFHLSSDEGSRLTIGGRVVVDNDEYHKRLTTKVGKIALRAGMHALRMDYFERRQGPRLEIRWEGPGIPKQLIPAANLFCPASETSEETATTN